MKNLLIASLLLLTTLGLGQNKPYQLVETVEKSDNELNIPYKKYEFTNGLILLVHEDHSDPVVHVDVTYHVGSAREEIGRSGFAHFFEHMMFQGSDNVADEQHFKIITEAGGNLNGTTNMDRTNYFETMPANELETGLWLEADRMGFLLDAVTQKKFEVQRGTVKNERGQNYDNRPYGLVYEKTNQALYPYGHPYSWPTIGYIEDLDRVNVDDLKKFFLRWYGPNNAVLTVAGDVQADEVAELAAKYFSTIPRGPEVNEMTAEKIKLESNRYISYEDKKIRFPLLSVSYPGVPRFHKDEAPLDVLANIIGGGKNSIFYQKFIKSNIARAAFASNPAQELGGQMTFSVYAYPFSEEGDVKTLADIEAMIHEAFKEFEERGVTDEDLTRYKSITEARMIKGLASVSGKASQLASYQTFEDNPDAFAKDLQRYLDVTKEDVIRVYNEYIKNSHAVVLSVYPQGQANLVAAPDNFTPKAADLNDADNSEYEGLTYNKAKDDPSVLDRSKKPESGPSPVINVPAIYRDQFDNKLLLIGTTNTEIPVTTLRLTVDCGHRRESKDKSGTAELMANMLKESTESSSAEEIAERLEILGSSINVSSGDNAVSINITSLTKNLDATLEIAEEMIFHPAFNEDDFSRVKNQHLGDLANMATSGRTIASAAVDRLLYKDNHILSVSASGTETTINNITLEDVKQFYATNFVPNIARLVVVSDLNSKEVDAKLGIFKSWKGMAPKMELNAGDHISLNKGKIVFIHQDDAQQSEIRIVKMAPKFDAMGEYFKTNLANFPFAGNFNSRLNLYIREEKNWSYGTGGYLSGGVYEGPYMIYGGILKTATDSAINVYIDQINDYQKNGVTEEEIDFMKKAIGQKDALKYETGDQKAYFISRILVYGLPTDYTAKQAEIMNNITQEELNKIIADFYNVNEMMFIVVGDQNLMEPQLKDIATKNGFDFETYTIDQILGNAPLK